MHDRLRPLAEAAGVELVGSTSPRPRVGIPRKRLEQLLVNLVRNALRAVSRRRRRADRDLRAAPGDGVVESGSRTTGPASTRASSPRVFERFYRGGSAGKPRKRQRARPHGRAADRRGRGRPIVAESAGGSGLRVTGRLPALDAVAGGAHAAASRSIASSRGRPASAAASVTRHAPQRDALHDLPVADGDRVEPLGPRHRGLHGAPGKRTRLRANGVDEAAPVSSPPTCAARMTASSADACEPVIRNASP